MTETKIMLHAGGWEAKREEVEAVALPEKTWSYTPIPHGRIIELLEELIPTRGMKIENSRYALNSHGNKMFGVMDITNGNGQSDWSLALGFRNSYDKSLRFELVGGSRVFVCDNLAFNGAVRFASKHIGSVDRTLRFSVGTLLDGFVETKGDIVEFINSMKQTPIDDKDAHDFICRSVRFGVLPTSHVDKVLDQWYEPKHEEFGARNRWSLYNAYTEVAKTRSEGLQMTSTIGLTNMMKEWVR